MTFDPDALFSPSEALRQRLGRAVVRARTVAIVSGRPTAEYCVYLHEHDVDTEVLLTRDEALQVHFTGDRGAFAKTFAPLAETCGPDEIVIVLGADDGSALLFKLGVDVQFRSTLLAPGKAANDGALETERDLTLELTRTLVYALTRARWLAQRFGITPQDVCLVIDEAKPVGHDLLFPIAEARAQYPDKVGAIEACLQEVAAAGTDDNFVAVVRELNGRVHVLVLGSDGDEATRPLAYVIGEDAADLARVAEPQHEAYSRAITSRRLAARRAHRRATASPGG